MSSPERTEPTEPDPVPTEVGEGRVEVESPGSRLAAARASRGMSVDDLAAHTRLARHVIEALESDDERLLAEPVYVRGYYRKCAQVLGLDAESLIAAYEARVQPRPLRASARALLSGANPPQRRGISGGLVLALVIVAVLALVFVARRPQPAAEQVPPVVIPGTLAPADAPARPLAAETQPERTEPAVEGGAHPTGESAEPAGEARPDQTMPVQVAPSEARPPAAQPAAAAGGEPEPEAVPTLPQARLVVRFDDTSWIRVEDADGRVLASREFGPGTERRFEGRPPLRLFLGNAPAVRLEFDGQEVDLAPYTRSNRTARLTLPREEE